MPRLPEHSSLHLRRLSHSPENIDLVQSIFAKAPKYFNAVLEYPAAENEAEEALTILPPNTRAEQKYNIGLFFDSDLIGYSDVINGYPDESVAYLGLLLFSEEKQRRGFGLTAYGQIEQLIQSWPKIKKIRLGVADSNDVTGFWKKMGFVPTGRILPCHQPKIKARIIEMEKEVDRYSFLSVETIAGRRMTLRPLTEEDLPSAGFRKVEIGFTWIADRWHRTFVNTEMKFLMLKHAFEKMKTHRVEFSVHPNNQKSNDAMKRIGATLEGTLRKWRFRSGLTPDDGHRNIYSIIDDEWPEIERGLQTALKR